MHSKDDKSKIPKVTKRNATIVEIRHRIRKLEEEKRLLKEQLEELEAEYRREMILGSLEVEPCETWEYDFHYEDRYDKELVVKAVACGAFDRAFPWRFSYEQYAYRFKDDDEYSYQYDDDSFNNSTSEELPKIPEELHGDPDVFLAYMQRDEFAEETNHGGFKLFVPMHLRQNKEVMMEICAKYGPALESASITLRDDEEVVTAALLGSAKYLAREIFLSASDRLRSDKDFIVKLIQRIGTDIKHQPDGDEFFSIESALSFLKERGHLSFEDDKCIASALLQRYIDSKKHCFLNNWQQVPLFSHALYDDKETMMKFVQHNWENIRACSNRLRSCKDIVDAAISQNKNAHKYALGSYREELIARQQQTMDKAAVISALEKKEVCFVDISDDLKSDVEVLETALQTGGVDFCNLSEDLRQNVQLIFAAAAQKDGVDEDFFELVPECWYGNEELVLALLEGRDKFEWLEDLLEMFPFLHNSKEVMIAVTNLSFDHPFSLRQIMSKTPFHDDEEVMLAASAAEIHCLQYASDRLMSDRDFISDLVEKVKYQPLFLLNFLSEDFKKDNTDIIVRVIECIPDDDEYERDILDRHFGLECVLDQRDVIMACVKTRQRNILRHLCVRERASPLFIDDEDIVRRVLRYDPSEIRYASRRLLNDRDFIHSVAGMCGHYILSDAINVDNGDQVRRDDGILAAAIASDEDILCSCQYLERYHTTEKAAEHFEWLVGFASRIRSRLGAYDSFYTVLCGISCHRPHVAPSWRCYLPRLDRGEETSTMFKKLIAEYADIPLGNELHELQKVSTNLLRFGF